MDELIYYPRFCLLVISLILLVLVLLIRTRRQERELRRLRPSIAELLAAAQICLDAERERRKRLLPGAPATSYTQNRINLIEASISRVKGGATKCAHVWEARNIDGSNRAAGPWIAVCKFCGTKGGTE